MAQRGKFDVTSFVVRKLTIAALAVVVYRAKPSYAYCLCPALAYCSLVSTTDLIVSGSIVKSTTEEQEYPDDSFYVSEYKLKIDHVYKDEVDFTVPDTPRSIKFTSSGQGLESCRLDLDLHSEYVMGITVEEDGSFSSHACSVTKAVDALTEEQLEALEAGGCSSTIEESP